MQHWILTVCLGVSLSFPLFSQAASENTEQNYAKQRQIFLKAEYAARDPKKFGYKKLYDQLDGYPLQPYAELAYLKRRPFMSMKSKIEAFLEAYEGTPMDWPLRRPWLEYLAQKGQKTLFLQFYRPTKNAGLQCTYYRYQLEKQPPEKVWPEIEKLWLVVKTQPRSCNALFKKWKKSGNLTQDLIWKRLRLAITNGNYALIPYLHKQMPKDEKYLADLWLKVRRSSSYIRNPDRFIHKNEKEKEIAIFGMKRLIWKDRELAIKTWKMLQDHFDFAPQQAQQVIRTISVSLATAHDRRALDWLAKLPAAVEDKTLLQWQVAAPLRFLEWDRVRDVINALPVEKAKENAWRYWLARSLEQEDTAKKDATIFFQELAMKRNYYGFLAASRIGLPPQLQHRPMTTGRTAIPKVAQHAGVLRAAELYKLKRYVPARREWHYLKSVLPREEQFALAQVAKQNGWFDRVILILPELGYMHDVEMRFPLAYKASFSRMSRQNKISPSWAFAVTRKESLFMTDAHSSSGALGLMQLLPSTAKEVAKRRLKKNHLYNPTTNIKLGTKYLKQLLRMTKGNHTMATAAYNAGFTNVRRWLPDDDKTMPTDIWIESIPFSQTRDYVKSVLAFQQIYAIQLGETQPFINDVVEGEISAL